MRVLFLMLFIFGCEILSAQQLHHEMISAQGGSVTTANGQLVRYTVGQQSVTGTSSNGYVVQQGFQQSNWGKILEQNTISIATIVFPNPFVNQLNIKNGNDYPLELRIFNATGQLLQHIKNISAGQEIQLGSNYRSGIYIIEATGNGEKIIRKVLKS